MDTGVNKITESVIGAAIEVHRTLGPGLLESAYEECLCRELALRKLEFQRQLPLPVEYKGVKLTCGYRIDLLVAGAVVVEIKAVEDLTSVHEAQLLTYLRLSPHFSPTVYCIGGWHCVCCVTLRRSPRSTWQYASGDLGRKPCIHSVLHRFATKAGEKCGLADGRWVS